jgi:hypothetical protein
MQTEEAETITETTPEGTPDGSQGYGDALKGEGTAPQDSPVGEPKSPQGEGEPQGEKPAAQKSDPLISIEIDGKTFTGKQSVIQKYLDLLPQFEGNETALLDALHQAEKLAELKRNYDKGYTQKYQELADQRKSFEESFGRMPEKPELEALGKVYQAYFSDPDLKAAIDAVLSGQPVRNVFAGTPSTPGQPQGQVPMGQDAYVRGLEGQIRSLQSELRQFTTSFTAREEAQKAEAAQRTWTDWVASKEKQGIKISEDIDGAMVPFIHAFRQTHPEWDGSKILDEAYRHATIGQGEKKIAAQILTDAEKAKKGSPPKITPKSGQVPDDSKGYSDIFLER